MNREIATKRAFLKKENAKYARSMEYIAAPWPYQPGCDVVGVWRSRDYLAQLVVEEKTKVMRLSIQRTMLNEKGDWEDRIPWEEMQRVKSEVGLGHALAVEVYPRDKDVVNVANIRHLFMVPVDFEIGWVSN